MFYVGLRTWLTKKKKKTEKKGRTCKVQRCKKKRNPWNPESSPLFTFHFPARFAGQRCPFGGLFVAKGVGQLREKSIRPRMDVPGDGAAPQCEEKANVSARGISCQSTDTAHALYDRVRVFVPILCIQYLISFFDPSSQHGTCRNWRHCTRIACGCVPSSGWTRSIWQRCKKAKSGWSSLPWSQTR